MIFNVPHAKENQGMADMNESPKPINTGVYDCPGLIKGGYVYDRADE